MIRNLIIGAVFFSSATMAMGSYYVPIAVGDITIFIPTMPKIIDGETGLGIDGVTVSVRECDACELTTVTTPTYSGIAGSYSFGTRGYSVLTDVEAVRIDISRAGYETRTIFKQPDSGFYFGHDIQLYANSRDSDADGLPDNQELQLGTSPVSRDTDDDSIPDEWEVNGHDYVDYPSLGSNPLHKTIFVECDFMQGQGPFDGAIQDVVDSFARAPLVNPDNSQGIDLRITIDDEVVRDDNLSPVWTEFDAIKLNNFNTNRRSVFHYCLFAVQYTDPRDGLLTESSGIARRIASNDFLVSLGGFPGGVGTRQLQAGTLMHELGHTLGLRHGGNENLNYKPNYLSNMNYSFQLRGLRFNNVFGLLDYSRFTLAALNEGNLNEAAGLNVVDGIDSDIIGYGTLILNGVDSAARISNIAIANVDWNNNSVIDPDNVAIDINRDGILGTLRTSWNDWDNLIYDGGGAFGAGVSWDSLKFRRRFIQSVALDDDADLCPGPND